MFRDAAQAARAVRALLGQVDLAELWTEEGPTDPARALRRKQRRRTREERRHRLPVLTREQRVVVLAAWSIWTLHRPEPGRAAGLREVVVIGPPPCRLAIGQLVTAMAFETPERWDMIDGWITRWGRASASVEGTAPAAAGPAGSRPPCSPCSPPSSVDASSSSPRAP